MGEIFNQHSYVVVAAIVLFIAWTVLRRVARWMRRIMFIAVIALVAAGMGLLRTGGGDIAQASDVQTALADGKPVAVQFYSDWCIACLAAKPFVDGLERELDGKAQILRADIRSDVGADLAQRFGIKTVPGFVVLTPDGKVRLRFDGVRTVPVGALREALGS
jgi:thiol-disulfide isomerase/thioredoxin